MTIKMDTNNLRVMIGGGACVLCKHSSQSATRLPCRTCACLYHNHFEAMEN